jgi:hypothetical protein
MSKKINMKSPLSDQVKVDMVSADDMFVEDRNAIFNRESSVHAIPDLDVLTGNVYEILQYLERPEISKLLKTNDTAVKMYLNNKYADTVPLGIISLLMEEDARNENVEQMLTLFESLRQAKSGKMSLEDAEKKLTDDVSNRYLYSKYGSKDAFEKALMCEVKNEQSKKGAKNAESLRNTGKARFNN